MRPERSEGESPAGPFPLCTEVPIAPHRGAVPPARPHLPPIPAQPSEPRPPRYPELLHPPELPATAPGLGEATAAPGRTPRGGAFRCGAALKREAPSPRAALPQGRPPSAPRGRTLTGQRRRGGRARSGSSAGRGSATKPRGEPRPLCGSGLSKRKHDAGGEGEGGAEISRGPRAALARRRPLPAPARRAAPRRPIGTC